MYMKNLNQTYLIFFLSFMVSSQFVNANELMDVDKTFNEMAQSQGIAEAFDHYLANNAVNLNGGYDVVTRSEIVAGYQRRRNTLKMMWWPVTSNIADSDELGYTWGRFIEYKTHEDSKVEEIHGKYLAIWKRNANGEWKSMTGMGVLNPPPTLD